VSYKWLYSFFLSFIHSSCSLFSDTPIVSSKTRSPQRAIECFVFKTSVNSLLLKVIHQLLTSYSSSSILPSIFSSIKCLEGSSYGIFSLLFVGYFSPPWLFVILLHISNDRTDCSSPSFSSTTSRNFPGISDSLYKVSKYQYQKRLRSKRSTSLFTSLNLSPICLWKEPYSCLRPLLPWVSNKWIHEIVSPPTQNNLGSKFVSRS
jgi:hypothetical protein